ncbi:MAG: methyltransferase domain-containing protein [Spongiibacteraceae bacterium]|jgi:23S rRNA (uracil1939-C5)-methyltransferase|nr:methyltransferase domain-containing protein [Spongiibacteraceae bacterium]
MATDGGTLPVFVAGALPGERVAARLTRRSRQVAEAELLVVEQAVAERRQPECPVFGRCGGCQLQMLDAAAQLAHKQQILQQLLEPFDVAEWLPPLTAEVWGYRHRARLAVGASREGRPVVGFRAPGSHEVVTVARCAVLDTRLQEIEEQLPYWLARLSHWRRVSELLLAVDAQGRLALSWRAAPALPAADAARLTELAEAAGVTIDPDDLLYSVPGVTATGGAEKLGYHFRLDDFTQVNPAVNRQLVEQVCRWLQAEPDDLVADYFCGLGNFTLALAATGASVVGFESVPAMVARASSNAARLGLAGRVTFETVDLFSDVRIPAGITKALLDPPRAGARALCEQLAKRPVARVAYVSCNPQTLARDLQILRQGGYQLHYAALADMFPQTGHSEALVLLSRV